MRFLKAPAPAELRSPEHLRKYAALETGCTRTHILHDSDQVAERKKRAEQVAEVVWNEGFTAGVAHALATMSVRYMVVTAEEKAAMIEKMEGGK